MTDRTERYEVEDGASISVRIPSGEVRIVEGDTGTLTVRVSGSDQAVARYLVERRGGGIVVEPDQNSGWRGRWASVRVLIEAGVAPAVTGRLASGDLSAEAPLASLAVDTAAGDVRADTVTGDVTVKSASGEVRLGTVGGRLEVTLASGDLDVGSVAGDARIHSASGDLRLRRADGDVTAKTASGDLSVGRFGGRSLNAKTLSGDVTVGVPPGRAFDVSFQALSGSVSTEFPVTDGGAALDDGRMRVTSVSGNIMVQGVD